MGNALGRTLRSHRNHQAAHAAILKAQLERAPPTEVELPDDNGDQLHQLLRAIESRPLDLYKDSKDVASMKLRRVTKEQKEAALVGRLDTPSLRSALEEVLRFEREGREVDITQLAKKYDANEEVLRKTLSHCGLVPVEQAPDGRLVARAKTAWAHSGG